MEPFELRHLRHLAAVTEHRSFSRAAEVLELSQPALSRSIAELERRADGKLVSRNASGVELTELGLVLMKRGRLLIREADEMTREVRAVRGAKWGELRVGCGVYPAEMFVGRALARFVREYPNIRVRVENASFHVICELLRQGQLDLAIAAPVTIEPLDDLDVESYGWFTGHAVVRPGHPLASRPRVVPSDIVRFPMVVSSRLAPDILQALNDPADRGRGDGGPPLPTIVCDSTTVMKRIIEGSDAIALLTKANLRDELPAGRLVLLPFAAPWLGRDFAALRPRRRTPLPTAEVFLAMVRESASAALAECNA